MIQASSGLKDGTNIKYESNFLAGTDLKVCIIFTALKLVPASNYSSLGRFFYVISSP